MGVLRVELRPATGAGRLYPRYGADILSLESRLRRPWAYGVNLDSLIIFDLDADRVLANVDVLLPRRRWRTARALDVPRVWKQADLIFTPETVAHKNFSLPISTAAVEHKTRVRIEFGSPANTPAPAVRAIALSEACLALVQDDILIGFDVTLGR